MTLNGDQLGLEDCSHLQFKDTIPKYVQEKGKEAKFSIWLLNHHPMKAYGKVKIQFYGF
jgi:hypothetical protein